VRTPTPLPPALTPGTLSDPGARGGGGAGTGMRSGVGQGSALTLLLSPEASFVRGILVEELAKVLLFSVDFILPCRNQTGNLWKSSFVLGALVMLGVTHCVWKQGGGVFGCVRLPCATAPVVRSLSEPCASLGSSVNVAAC
jgi:hypothetical protein